MNGNSLEDVTHEHAVQVLKNTQDRVVIVITREGMTHTDSGTPPPVAQEALKTSK